MTEPGESQISRRRGNRRAIAAAIIVTAVVIAGMVWARRDDLFGEAINPGTPLPAAGGLTEDETAFYERVAPRLRSAAAEAQALTDLGKAKSRNLIELQRRGNHADEIGNEIDGLVAAGVPDRFAAAIERYEIGIAAVRRAMDETRSAFASFDWDRIARAVNIMEAGADNLATASQGLEQAAGVVNLGTPASQAS